MEEEEEDDEDDDLTLSILLTFFPQTCAGSGPFY